MHMEEQLYTAQRAALTLKIPVERIKSFLRHARRGLHSKVTLSEVRAWLAEFEESRRQSDEWEYTLDVLMLLDKHGLALEDYASASRCAQCGEPRLDAGMLHRLRIGDDHRCRAPEHLTPAST